MTTSRGSKNQVDYAAGFSLVATLVAVAGMGIVALGIMRVTGDSLSAAGSAGRQSELESLKRVINDEFDCGVTLGLLPATLLPVTCPAPTLISRRQDGQPLFPLDQFGQWTITADCAGEIKFKATRTGNDPSGRPYSSYPAATDVFEGISDFCKPYFENNVVGDAGGIYQWYLNKDGPETVCRIENPITNDCSCPPGYLAHASSSFWGQASWHPAVPPALIGHCDLYEDGHLGPDYCGYRAYVCQKI